MPRRSFRSFLGRPWVRAVAGLFMVVGLGLFALLMRQWKRVSDNGGQQYATPFQIAGNLYYVGANDISAFLLTGPEGHVLIDGGYPGTADMIMASIAELGFDVRDVRILLTTHFHLDHAGGLAAIQEASGAELWVSEGDADGVASGGDHPSLGILRLVVWSGMARYPRAAHYGPSRYATATASCSLATSAALASPRSDRTSASAR